jgi:hypothetical protein
MEETADGEGRVLAVIEVMAEQNAALRATSTVSKTVFIDARVMVDTPVAAVVVGMKEEVLGTVT